jgi:LmbE family N-acetylglucosaminyl deacetylase
MLRMLCVTAHPDDEAGNFGGSLLLYNSRGVETYVICLTPGQAASHRGGARTDQELATLRRKEFAASCQILRVTRGEVLDYADAHLHRIDLYSVVSDLTRRIRDIRPQVVLTFGAEGGVTGHPDHAMAGVFASLAFQWAGRSNRFSEQLTDGVTPHRAQKLYFSTASFMLTDRQPISPPPVTCVIEIGDFLDKKIAAFHAHTSQSPLFPIFEGTVRQRGKQELFHLAASSSLQTIGKEIETDLFAGVKDE